MASRSTVVVDTSHLVIVRLDHGIADSFSRSVLPTSTRAWRRAINCSHATRCRVAELAPDWTVDGTRCASFVAFGPTHAAAQGGLTAYLDTVPGARLDLTST